MAEHDEEWLPTAEAARRRGVHPSTVYRWCHDGVVRYRTVPRVGEQRPRWLVYWPDVARATIRESGSGRPSGRPSAESVARLQAVLESWEGQE